MLAWSARGQMLVVDRAPQGAGAAVKVASGFVGDHFSLGAAGEVWVIDSVRVWVVPGKSSAKVTLFGGIEAPPPKPGDPECDCHNLMPIQSTAMIAGAAFDFKDVRWSVPGGSQIQFGVLGLVPRGVTGGSHQLKKFDAKGKLLGEREGGAGKTGIAVQVWAHLSAGMSIQQVSGVIEVTLHGAGTFEVTHADVESLRFGPAGAAPLSNKIAGGDLVLTFSAADAGIRAADLTACLAGRLQNGVPFEACDGLAAARGK